MKRHNIGSINLPPPVYPPPSTSRPTWTSPIQDNVLGPAPAKDVLLQLEIKMEEQVKAYLERMQEVGDAVAWGTKCS